MSACRTVAIVDDDEMVRFSVVRLVEGAGHRALGFATGDEFLAAQLPEDLDCVLLDLQMPGRSGLEVLEVLRGRGDAPAVLVVTGHGNIALAVEAIKRGAVDFIEKPYPAAKLLAAIEAGCVQRDGPRASEALRREACARLDSLSPRQREVLRGVATGKSNKVMARELGLSIRTVEAHRSQLLQRLGASGTADVVRIGLATGFASAELKS
jgi:two-component system response regulator FixJ